MSRCRSISSPNAGISGASRRGQNDKEKETEKAEDSTRAAEARSMDYADADLCTNGCCCALFAPGCRSLCRSVCRSVGRRKTKRKNLDIRRNERRLVVLVRQTRHTARASLARAHIADGYPESSIRLEQARRSIQS